MSGDPINPEDDQREHVEEHDRMFEEAMRENLLRFDGSQEGVHFIHWFLKQVYETTGIDFLHEDDEDEDGQEV